VRSPFKGTFQEKKVVHKQEEAFFLRSSRHLIDSFAAGPIYSQRFMEISVFSLLKDNLYRVIHLFPIAVVSLGKAFSVRS